MHRVALESLESRRLMATFTVTSALDTVDPNDGVLTFREAIEAANANVNGSDGDAIDQIHFDIGGDGVQTIQLNSGLSITDAVNIDGYTQAGAKRNTKASGTDATLLIEVTAADGSPSFDGITIEAGGGGSSISGLAIGGIDYSPIAIESNGNHIDGNYIGLNAAGTDVRSNGDAGIDFGNGSNNFIGGTDPGDRNVIAGSVSGVSIAGGTQNTLQNNYIGTNATGTATIANGTGLLLINSTNNLIGGTAPGVGNVISGNTNGGIAFTDASNLNTVQGNRIGVDATGHNTLGNGFAGVYFNTGSSNNLIGGTAPGAGNVIADNAGAGITAFDTNGTVVDPAANSFLSNSIYGNTGLGIDLSNGIGGDGVTANDTDDSDVGPNGFTNFPVLTTAYTDASTDTTVVTGIFNGLANQLYTFQFFANDASDTAAGVQGRTLIGRTTVTTDGSGNASFAAVIDGQVALDGTVTATATAATVTGDTLTYQDTSEFSAAVAVQKLPPLPAFTVTPSAASIVEGDSGTKTVTFTVKLSQAYPLALNATYGSGAETATSGQDYEPYGGTLTFAAGETTKTFDVTIKGDTVVELNEVLEASVTLKIGNLANTVDSDVTIINDDVDPSQPVTLQGEDAVLAGGTFKSASNGGFNATGYADFGGKNSSAQWTVQRPAAGGGQIAFRYANGGSAARPLIVYVNGVAAGTLPFDPTGSWTTWKNASINVSLKAGANVIKLVASTDQGGANIDQLTFTPGAVPPPPANGSISGVAFNDSNANGKLDKTEVTTSGKTVFLDTNNNGKLDSGETYKVTDSTGAFSFNGLSAGTYHVRRVYPAGYTYSTKLIDLVLTNGQAVGGLLIGSRTT